MIKHGDLNPDGSHEAIHVTIPIIGISRHGLQHEEFACRPVRHRVFVESEVDSWVSRVL